MNRLPNTTAHLRVYSYSVIDQCVVGEVSAGEFEWEFKWVFNKGELIIEPSLGRALIHDSLFRFLVKSDYRLEAGGDYIFNIRAHF